MASASISGVAAAVIVDKQIVWTRGYGYADVARTRPFTPATIMNAGSIAKTFTGVAMMRAVQDGTLSLDEDINRYLPFRVENPGPSGAPSSVDAASVTVAMIRGCRPRCWRTRAAATVWCCS